MAEGARDVGHELLRRRAEVLNQFRRGLAVLTEQTPSNSYAHGFCDALEHVTAAFVAESSNQEDLAKARSAVEAKPRWTKVLRALMEGHLLPKDISVASGMPASSVTRTLQELEEASLIERPLPSVEADARSRPCAFTSVGAELAHRLFKDADPRLAAVRDVLPVIMRFWSSLISQRRVTSIELLQMAETKVGWGPAQCLVEEIFDAAKKSALAVREPEVAIAVFEVPDLSKVLTVTRGEPLQFQSLKPIIADGVRTYVCSSRWQYLWDQWARIGGLDHVTTLNIADLHFGPPLSSPYQVLYDDPIMVNRDVEHEPSRGMLAAASQRFCLVPPAGQTIHPSFKPVRLMDDVGV
jgi:DNA-binding MarR family transcriptional regulator